MLTSLAQAVRGLSLGVWLGAGVMTFITASYVFGGLPRNTAGDIMGAILHTGGLLKIGLAVLALGSHLYLRQSNPVSSRASNIGLYTLIFATVLAVFVAFYLEPKMVELREHFRSADESFNPPERVLFRKLHGASMGIALLELLLIAVALVCIVI